MTAFELEQLYFLRGEIRMHDKALERLEREYEAAHWPEKVQEVREIIEGMRRRCMAQLESLERWLAAVPDDFMRDVLTLRYSEGLTWKNAAIKPPTSLRSSCWAFFIFRYFDGPPFLPPFYFRPFPPFCRQTVAAQGISSALVCLR